jgi:arginine repressor
VVLDGSGRTDMIGTIAGDDTILIIAPSNRAARELVVDFDRLARSAGVSA